MSVPYRITPNEVIWYSNDGTEHRVTSDNTQEYLSVVTALQAGEIPGNEEGAIEGRKIEFLSAPEIVCKYSAIKDRWEDVRDLHNLTKEQVDVIYESLVEFAKKVDDNPSWSSREQLMEFVTANKVPILPNGDMLLFKRVRDNYFDCHTGCSFEYRVGTTHKMNRRDVQDDPSVACGEGLHCGGYDYVSGFYGDRIIACQVDPFHVVSVPKDSNAGKVRVCQLEVVAEFPDLEAMKRASEAMCAMPWDEYEKLLEKRRQEALEVERAYDEEDEEWPEECDEDSYEEDYYSWGEYHASTTPFDVDNEKSGPDVEWVQDEEEPAHRPMEKALVDEIYRFIGSYVVNNSMELTEEFRRAIYDFTVKGVKDPNYSELPDYQTGWEACERAVSGE